MASSKNQGARSRNVKEVPVRVGRAAQEQRPRGVSQIGESIGNKATEGGKVRGVPSEVIQGKRLPPNLSVSLGNAVALNVGKGGPGTGRNLWGKSGTNCTTGPVNPGVPGLPSTKGSWPD
jgi:hypothetical protein